MPTPKKGTRLGGSAAHQRLILRNLATALFEHGRITTTEAKARVLRPYAEKLITKAKKGDLHSRRQVLRQLYTGVDLKRLEETGEFVVNAYPQHRLFTEIGPSFADRPGGYTRITKLGPRKGDNAPMAVIELVTESFTPSAPKQQPTAPTTPAAPAVEVEKVDADAPAEVEATDEGGTEQVLDTSSVDVETAEAQSEAPTAASTEDGPEAGPEAGSEAGSESGSESGSEDDPKA